MLWPTFKTELQNVAPKLHLLLAKVLLSFQCQRAGPTVPCPLPRSCSPWLHHLSGDRADKVNQPVTWGGLTQTLSNWDVRHSQSFLPAPSHHPREKGKSFLTTLLIFPPAYFCVCGGTSIHVTRFLEGFPALLQIWSTGMHFLSKLLSSCIVRREEVKRGIFLNKDFSLIVSEHWPVVKPLFLVSGIRQYNYIFTDTAHFHGLDFSKILLVISTFIIMMY